MNWTGGKLQRHSKRNKSSTLYRQKQYFARVRQQLQQPARQQQTSFKPSFLVSDDMSPRRQSHLEDFRNTAPLAQRLASMSPHKDTQTAWPRNVHDGDVATMLRSKKRRRPINSSPEQTPAHEASSQSKSSNTLVPNGDNLESMRRHLLMQSDWVGVKPMEPLHMKFTSTQEREQFGRRHKIEKRKEGDPEDQAHRYRVPSISNGFSIHGQFDEQTSNKDSLKIRIGDDALTSTWFGSNTQTNTHAGLGLDIPHPVLTRTVSNFDTNVERHEEVADTQDMLDDMSFYGFSDSSHQQKHWINDPSPIDGGQKVGETKPPNTCPKVAQHTDRGHLILSSSQPTTAPEFDMQSNAAAASTRLPVSSRLVRSDESEQEDHEALLSPDNERLWRNFMRVKETELEDHGAQHQSHPTLSLSRGTRNKPYIIPSSSSSNDISAPPPSSPPPTALKPHPPAASIPPTTSPSASYRCFTTLAAAPKPFPKRAPSTAPTEKATAQALRSDPDAMWKAFVFGDISPTRVSTNESLPKTQQSTSPITDRCKRIQSKMGVDSSLRARASVSQVTDIPDDSSILGRDPSLMRDEARDARTDAATLLHNGVTSSSLAHEGGPREADTFTAKPALQPKLSNVLASSPDSVKRVIPAKRKILFSPPKKFAVPSSGDTGRDVVCLGGNLNGKKKGEHGFEEIE